MSNLPEEAVREFAELYKQEYGIELSPEEASFRARNLLDLYAAVLLDEHADTSSNAIPP